ncbi:MAG: hypothetical protein IT368_15175, partial [Candidatus Hydrogenedentes bacterium]|nr:hypothetical protein [Candidatus Hydrogenedentota bacterium]
TGTAYLGSEPLDPALADRFALILPLPEFKDYSETDQVNVILKADGAIPADAAAELRRIVASGRSVAKTLQEEQGPVLAEYVREVVLRLGQAGVTCSPRRAAILLRNVAAVHAAQLVLGGSPRLQDSAWLAVRFGLPVTAAGQKLSEMRVLAAHKEAWSQVSIPKKSPLRLVMQEQDPLRRVLLACRLDELSRSDFSVLVADVLAELRPGARHAVAALLFEEDRAGKLSAAVAEEAAELYLTVCTPQDVNSEVRTDGLAYRMYTAITKILSEIPAEEPETLLMTNLLLGLWKAEEIASEEQVRDIVNDWQTTRRQFGRGAE